MEIVKNHLQQFSTPKESKKQQEQYEAILAVLASFQKKTGSFRTIIGQGIDSNDKNILLDFVSYLTDNNELSNLKTRIKNQINSEFRFSNVPGKIKENLIDYVDTRCSVWIENCTSLNTTRIQQLTLGDYNESVFNIHTWINSEIDGKGFENFMLPVAQEPKIDLESFRTKLKEWSDETVKDTFSLNFFDQVGIAAAEAGNNIGYEATRFKNQMEYEAKRAGAWLNNLFSKDKKTVTRKETERKPDFDRDKEFNLATEKIDILLSKENFEEIYNHGKQNGLLDVKIPLLPVLDSLLPILSGNPLPTNLQIASLGMTVASNVSESINQAFIDEKCKKFCRAFKQCKYSIATGVSTSFDAWCKSTLSLLEGRKGSLSRPNPLIQQEDLRELDQAVIHVKSLLTSDILSFNRKLSKKYEEYLAKAETSIEDRKIASK